MAEQHPIDVDALREQFLNVSVVEPGCLELITGLLVNVDRHWRDIEPRVIERGGHFTNLEIEAQTNRLVDRALAFHELNRRCLLGRKPEAVDTIFRLQVVGGVERAI